jgi:hypothetical protein
MQPPAQQQPAQPAQPAMGGLGGFGQPQQQAPSAFSFLGQ